MIETKRRLLAVPSVVAALLPKFACPACAAAALGILNVAGLGYLLTASHLLPLTSAILTLTVAVMLYMARRQDEWWPLLIAVAGAVAIVSGKFLFESGAVLYSGIGLFVASSIWKRWPREARCGCATCDSPGGEQVHADPASRIEARL